MSRPRTPTKVLKIRGAFTKHPERLRERTGEPEITAPIGEPPECLDEAERARWAEYVRDCPWLNVTHRGILEQTCRLHMLERRGKATPAHSKLLQTNWRVMGMTPSDSSKVKMPSAKDEKKSLLA